MTYDENRLAYAYMVRCSDGSLYTGWCFNVDNRVWAHNLGKGAKYTRTRQPVTLVYSECCDNKSSAMRRECAIKKLSRKQKLELTRGPNGTTEEDS